MRYAIVENGMVVNIALAEKPMHDNWIEATDAAQIGGTWDGVAFGPAPPPDPAEALAAERAAARAYLAETDWLVVRSVETGTPLDDEVRSKRAEARRVAST